jgi:hypothetical protein
MMAGAAALACAGLMTTSARAGTVILYSTQGDFISGQNLTTDFTGNNGGTSGPVVSTVATVSSPTEGGTVNGIINSNPGGTGAAGSLAITFPNGLNSYQTVASTSYQNWGTTSGSGAAATLTPSALVNALDSGGTLTLQYTVPSGAVWMNSPQFILNYPGSYLQLSSTGSATTDANGFYTDTMSLAGISNIAQAELTSYQTNGYGYLTFGIIVNGDLPTGGVVNVANIEVQTPAVPEPASIGLLAIGGLGLLLLGRRRKLA